ncbi:MAG: hypothetical protein AAF587_17500 [Bacteroidota bacterium]
MLKTINILGRYSSKSFSNVFVSKIEISEDVFLFISGFSEFDIELGQVFSKAAKQGSTIFEQDFEAKLVLVRDSFGNKLDFIETGWRTIVGFRFLGDIPLTLKNLPFIQSFNDWEYKVMLYST